MNHFLSALPDTIGRVSVNTRVAVWPVPAFPIVTIELYIFIDGSIDQCCKQNGDKGLMATGYFGAEISGGVGTSVGGNSNVKTERGKNGIRYRNGRGGGTGRGGTFSKAPTVGNYGMKRATSPVAVSIGHKRTIPNCESSLKFSISVGISGFISGGAGFLSFGYQFDTKFGQCDIPGGCSFINPIKEASSGAVYGLGTGMRIAVYGRGGIDGKIEIR